MLKLKTLQGTELWINVKHIQFIQQNSNLGYVVVFQSGAAHNFNKEQVEDILDAMEKTND